MKVDMSEARFWTLYRDERRKIGPDKQELTLAQITRCARSARKRQVEG